jgi:hypothetical protein
MPEMQLIAPEGRPTPKLRVVLPKQGGPFRPIQTAWIEQMWEYSDGTRVWKELPVVDEAGRQMAEKWGVPSIEAG